MSVRYREAGARLPVLWSMCTEITKALSDQAKRSLCTPTALDPTGIIIGL